MRYVHKYRHWTLFWRDRNQRWHHYDLIGSSADVTVLLDEIDGFAWPQRDTKPRAGHHLTAGARWEPGAFGRTSSQRFR
jgi:hypothetical protein